jgi:hypothetical protein
MKVCIEHATESYQECSQWADHGYSSCQDWDRNCCTWWPCSWGCKVVSWVCTAAVWIANVVCVAWTTISTLVCIAWQVVQVVLLAVAILVELILAIPFVGRLIDQLLNVITEIVWRAVGLVDAIAGALGFTPLKKLRMCIVILSDERGSPVSDVATLTPHIDEAKRIFRDAANVLLIVEDIHVVGASPGYVLDVDCNIGAWGEDLGLPGSWFQWTSINQCPTGAVSRVVGYGNQVVVFCVRSIPGNTAGCALGPLTDYLTIEGRNPLCLAHELAHKCGLWHCCSGANLANGTCGGTQLDWFQRTIVRNSKFVTYF